MKPGHGKLKGSAYERDIATRLSLWVTDLRRKDVFVRSAGSGSAATFAIKKHISGSISYEEVPLTKAGDISCVHSIGMVFINSFVVECKHYAEAGIEDLLYDKGELVKMWKKFADQAQTLRREPFFIYRQNRKPELLFTSQRGNELLQTMTVEGDLVPVAVFPELGAVCFNFIDVLCNDFANFAPERVRPYEVVYNSRLAPDKPTDGRVSVERLRMVRRIRKKT